MVIDDTRSRNVPKSVLNSTTTSVGRFYEKRHQFHGALDQYSKALSSNPDDTAIYIDRSRIFLKMGSIDKAQEDTDSALNLIDHAQQQPSLLSYYVCLQKAEVLYADGEFELALMYFHRANKVKPSQQICLEGIRKATEILECTICNPNIHLTITSNSAPIRADPLRTISLLNRPPIRKAVSSVALPLTEYADREATRLLSEVAKDRKLLIHLYRDQQAALGFTGLDKAKTEARQAISIVESQLKFLDQAECLQRNETSARVDLVCSSNLDRATQIRIADEELKYLQQLSAKEKSMEILYRAMKIIHCLQPQDAAQSSLELRSRLMLAEAYRLVGQSYSEIHVYDQSVEHYQQAYDVLLPLNEQHCLYRATFDLARSLMLQTNYSQAIEIFLRMLDQSTSDQERAFVDQYVGFCYLRMQAFDQAKHYAYQALDHASLAKEELLRIEANILLAKIFFQLKDFSRAEEYVNYAQSLKDHLGDLGQMKSLEDFLDDIRKHRENIRRDKLSPFIQYEEEDRRRAPSPWISSAMQEQENNRLNLSDDYIEQITAAKIQEIPRWRVLTPYYHLFDVCTAERKKKSRRQVDLLKQPMIAIATPSPSLPNITGTT